MQQRMAPQINVGLPQQRSGLPVPPQGSPAAFPAHAAAAGPQEPVVRLQIGLAGSEQPLSLAQPAVQAPSVQTLLVVQSESVWHCAKAQVSPTHRKPAPYAATHAASSVRST